MKCPAQCPCKMCKCAHAFARIRKSHGVSTATRFASALELSFRSPWQSSKPFLSILFQPVICTSNSNLFSSLVVHFLFRKQQWLWIILSIFRIRVLWFWARLMTRFASVLLIWCSLPNNQFVMFGIPSSFYLVVCSCQQILRNAAPILFHRFILAQI